MTESASGMVKVSQCHDLAMIESASVMMKSVRAMVESASVMVKSASVSQPVS
jgi:hypothetical protein